MELKNISLYYEYIINLIVELYREELQNAKPGHCMKIMGMGNDEMLMLWDALVLSAPTPPDRVRQLG